jgi:hypothetical protein
MSANQRPSTRTTTPSRSYATRARRLLSEAPVPVQAQRGYSTNAYGDEEQLPITSGVADADSSISFAHELREQVDEAHKASTRSRTQEIHTSPPVQSKSRSPKSKSPPQTKRASTRITRSQRKSSSPQLDDNDDSLPSAGIHYKDRNFSEAHEGGLELQTDVPAFLDIVQIVFAVIWVFLYSIPILIFVYVCAKFGPSLWNRLPSSSSPSIFVPLPAPPQIVAVEETEVPTLKSSAEATIETSQSSRPWYARDRVIDDLRDEIHGVKSQIRLVSEEVRKLESLESASHRPNFFSPNLGAMIYPSYTTPTNARGTTKLNRAWNSFLTYMPGPWTSLPPPSTALLPWRENGDCWCASSSPNGALSLGIQLSEPVFPGTFIIDHISKRFALNITSAPKKLDLWAHVAPGFNIKDLPEEWRDNQKQCESTRPKGKNWVCLGKMFYNIDDSPSAQSLSLAGFDGYPPFKIDIAVLRVLENYGQEYTCLYQVKLDGWPGDRNDK